MIFNEFLYFGTRFLWDTLYLTTNCCLMIVTYYLNLIAVVVWL